MTRPDVSENDEAEGEILAKKALKILELPSDTKSLVDLRKGDWRKVLVAVLLHQRSAVGNSWLSDRLAMGHTASVSRLVADFKSGQRQDETTWEN